MKVGDILVSNATKFTSASIGTLTVSQWSHVAIVIKDNMVADAVPKKGVRNIPFSQFKQECRDICLLSRTNDLTDIQAETLDRAAKKAQKSPYSSGLCVNSGVVKFGLVYWFLNSCYLLSKFMDGSISANFLPIIFACLLFILPPALLFVGAKPERTNKLIEVLHLPKCWMITDGTTFCSEFVYQMDSRVGGSLNSAVKFIGQPRPVDIYNAAIDGKFQEVRIE
ncbi:YiiX/YebB-like N1pC/P60 family cysteine hydrolase [Vibrio coralliilyticus]|uniref:YiiX/YebB-like N1pC/P60 family cysteine hydrolase n=1 Tax=Vibrio coralliilyticus TaxID=190893 RepID=UPI0015CE22B6|nr:YiiX/YebB-like N1pC/P60 family cysteine hydrolase [Vibrio coralliilyticus]